MSSKERDPHNPVKDVRKRGIQASPEKLRQALILSGMQSQSDLAAKIQQLEQLKNPPRSLVSRVFKGEAVDPVSIERVASGLGVEAWTLYLTADEAEQKPTEIEDAEQPGVVTQPQVRTGLFNLLKAGVASIAAVLVIYQFFYPSDSTDTGSPAVEVSPVLQRFSLLLAGDDPAANQLIGQMMNFPQDKMTLASIADTEVFAGQSSADVVRSYQSDGLARIRLVPSGRYVQLEISLYANGVERLAIKQNVLNASLSSSSAYIAQQLLDQIHLALIEPEYHVSDQQREVSQMVLQARQWIDTQDAQQYDADIQASLLRALMLEPETVEAFGALCEAQRQMSWVKDEKQMLEEATRACEKGLLLAPNDVYLMTMKAEIDILIGLPEQAIKGFQQVLEVAPDYVLALNGLARAYIEAYNQQLLSSDASLQQGRVALAKAIELEPDFWFHHEVMGRLLFFADDIAASLPYSKRSAELTGNPVAMTNVGVYSLCLNLPEQAKQAFESVKSMAPHSHLGDEYLGLLAFYQHRFDDAVSHYDKALAILSNDQANIHQYWNYLADAYRFSGLTASAIDAYQQAIKALQHYKLRGVGGAWEEVADVYYDIQILALRNEPVVLSESQSQKLMTLQEQDLSSSVKMKLAQVYALANEQQQAASLWQQASATCGVYAYHPDFHKTDEAAGRP